MRDPSSYPLIWLGPEHAAAVSVLENICFPGKAWTAEQYGKALDGDPSFAACGCLAPDGELVGYIGLYHTADELEILNVGVLPSLRGGGIATRLLRMTLRRAGDWHTVRCFLEVREGNVPAIRLYRGAGFEQVGVRRRYYADTGEDAIVMSLGLTQAGE